MFEELDKKIATLSASLKNTQTYAYKNRGSVMTGLPKARPQYENIPQVQEAQKKREMESIDFSQYDGFGGNIRMASDHPELFDAGENASFREKATEVAAYGLTGKFSKTGDFLRKDLAGKAVDKFVDVSNDYSIPGLAAKMSPEDSLLRNGLEKTKRIEKLTISAAISGITGSIIAPKTEVIAEGLDEKIMQGIGGAVGFMVGLGKIKTAVKTVDMALATKQVLNISEAGTTIDKVLRGGAHARNFLAKYPRVYKTVVGTTPWVIYGQLDPDLGMDMRKRAHSAVRSAVERQVFELGLEKIPMMWKNIPVRLPAGFSLGYGMAKYDGANNEDAFVAGTTLAAFIGAHQVGVKTGMIPKTTYDQPTVDRALKQEGIKYMKMQGMEIKEGTSMEDLAREYIRVSETAKGKGKEVLDWAYHMVGDPKIDIAKIKAEDIAKAKESKTKYAEGKKAAFPKVETKTQTTTDKYVQTEIVKSEAKNIAKEVVTVYKTSTSPEAKTAAGEFLDIVKTTEALDTKLAKLDSLYQRIEKIGGVDGIKITDAITKIKIQLTPKVEVAAKISDELMNTEAAANVYTELDTAKAGERITMKQENGDVAGNIGQKSTFPKWIPEHLRKATLVEQVKQAMITETVPKGKAARELYNHVVNEIRVRNGQEPVRYEEMTLVKSKAVKPVEVYDSQSMRPLETKVLDAEMPNDISRLNIDLSESQKILDDIQKQLHTNPELMLSKDSKTRMTQHIVDLYAEGQVSSDSVAKILEKYPTLKGEDVLQYLLNSVSEGAKLNAQVSALARSLNKLLPEGQRRPELEHLTPEGFRQWFKAWDGVRKGFLVMQLATTARNIMQQGVRSGVMMAEDFVVASLEVMTGAKTGKNAFATVRADASAFIKTFSKMGRAEIQSYIDQMPELVRAKTFDSYSSEVAMSDISYSGEGVGTKALRGARKFADKGNVLNKFQEFEFRKGIVVARLTAFLEQTGKKIQDLDIKDWEKFADDAMEITWAYQPKAGTFFHDVLSIYKKIPEFSTINPFPRFLGNSLRFLWAYNPTGFINFHKVGGFKGMAAGDAAAFRTFSKAMVGTTFLTAAVGLRESEFAGEKWYEIKTGGKTYDMRAYAPFSTYLFLAEAGRAAIGKPTSITAWDFAGAMLSLNRIAGTSLVMLDALRFAKNIKDFGGLVATFVGAYFGGFTVPFRVLKDAIAGVNPEEATMRYAKSDDIVGNLVNPAMQNIPFVSTLFPPLPNMTAEGYMMQETPWLKQLTGITMKEKTWVASEMDSLDIQIKSLYPATGNTKLDYLIMENMGKIVGPMAASLENDPAYGKMTRYEKKQKLTGMLTTARATATSRAKAEHRVEFMAEKSKQIEKLNAEKLK